MSSQPLIARPVFLLQAEGVCCLIASCVAFHVLFPHHWVLFACLFLVPDLSLLPYLKGPGAAASVMYNMAHTYVFPVLLGLFAALSHKVLPGEVSVVWLAHISLDRMIAAGLKYPAAFQPTHIQKTQDFATPQPPPLSA